MHRHEGRPFQNSRKNEVFLREADWEGVRVLEKGSHIYWWLLRPLQGGRLVVVGSLAEGGSGWYWNACKEWRRTCGLGVTLPISTQLKPRLKSPGILFQYLRITELNGCTVYGLPVLVETSSNADGIWNFCTPYLTMVSQMHSTKPVHTLVFNLTSSGQISLGANPLFNIFKANLWLVSGSRVFRKMGVKKYLCIAERASK